MVGVNQYKGRGELQSGAFFVISKERLIRYRNEVGEMVRISSTRVVSRGPRPFLLGRVFFHLDN